MYDIILFDFDGTIYDTLEGITKSMQYALNQQGIYPKLDELKCFAGPPLHDKLEEVYGFTGEKADEVVRVFRERYAHIGIYESCIFHGVEELLKKLKAAGKRLGIATSKPEVMANKLLEMQNIREYFEVVSGSSVSGKLSSKDIILREALRRFGSDGENAVLVGDTKYDVMGAHKCALTCIGVRYGYAADGELEDAGAKLIAENTEELYKILTA